MTRFPRWPLIKFLSERKSFISRTAEYCQPRCNFSEMWSVHTTRYSVIFQKFPSRVRVVQKILSSIRVAGTRWTLLTTLQVYPIPIHISTWHISPKLLAVYIQYQYTMYIIHTGYILATIWDNCKMGQLSDETTVRCIMYGQSSC